MANHSRTPIEPAAPVDQAVARPAGRLMRGLASLFAVRLSRNVYLCIIIGAALLAGGTLYSLCHQFHPADDYAIYEYFAEAVDNGQDPYSIEPKYRSEIVPRIFHVAGPQIKKGVINQRYADYPPLLMLANSVPFRVDSLKGLYVVYIVLYGLSVAMYALYATSRTSESGAPQVTPILLLLFFGMNPIFTKLWFNPITDKAWFAFFMVALLLLRKRPYAVTVLLGLLAALKGVGIPVMALYVLHLWVNKRVRPRQILHLLLVFGAIMALGHVAWFPDWRKGYYWRADRQTAMVHESLFVPLGELGLDIGATPLVLTGLFFILLAILVAGKRLMLEEVLLLPIVASIIFEGDAMFSRLLVIVLALLLLARHSRTILISYLLGIFLSLPSLRAYWWTAMWVWILYLLVETGLDIFRRNATTHAPGLRAPGYPTTSVAASQTGDASPPRPSGLRPLPLVDQMDLYCIASGRRFRGGRYA